MRAEPWGEYAAWRARKERAARGVCRAVGKTGMIVALQSRIWRHIRPGRARVEPAAERGLGSCGAAESSVCIDCLQKCSEHLKLLTDSYFISEELICTSVDGRPGSFASPTSSRYLTGDFWCTTKPVVLHVQALLNMSLQRTGFM